ncbi:FG-GAP-like repeat-containing protein [Microscilla marina]|uniref:FG-GAP repeat domain protein n=1 Tax=Microscilla marina ATCC 23134 TaxID=313606 RepID=A1ZP22_MICM2|nr:FG-GAP-like repeat-containing protein [Microscilla marina]EAY27814.1 FG-GAP repeat domain protein [Microscilla marina ATCC 23134]
MKTLNQYLIAFLCCVLPYIAVAQQFEKITSSTIASDIAASRSVAWVDVNGDGFLDAFVSNGRKGGENNSLYINQQDGSFTKKTNDPLVQDKMPSDGATWGDVDNDGDLDVYVVNWYGKANLFYLNDGKGNFTQIKNSNIIAGKFSETACWADYDKDGDLDLYVTNSEGERNVLIKNNGDGRFTVDNSQIVSKATKSSRSVNWVDFDNDNDLDLFVSNEGNATNELYINNGDKGFSASTNHAVVTSRASSMSSAWGDYDNDGDLDLFVANFKGKNKLFQNDGKGGFVQATNSGVQETAYSFGSIWGDIDNDGDLDLFVANATFTDTKVKNFLYLNNGNGTFTKVTNDPVTTYQGATFGAALGDYDNDGDLDLLTANTYKEAEANGLYRNKGNNHHWLNISLKGVVSNASAIGAKVRVKATMRGKSIWQMREISAQSGYNCQNSLRVHFGLGDAQKVDSLVIEWPLGIKEHFVNVQTKKFMSFQEPVTKGFLRVNFKTAKLQYNIQETVSFVNTSLTDTSESVAYSWDFDGDGTEDAMDENPNHIYDQAGTYAVKLTIINALGSHSIIRPNYIQVLDPNGVDRGFLPEVAIYPNPFVDYLRVYTDKSQLKKLILYDVKGRQIGCQEFKEGQSNTIWQSQHLPKGTYSITLLLSNGASKSFRVLKM